MKNKEKKLNKGITMIALIVTIVILLILAGITIGGLTGENGIIKNAQQAKEQTEISEEKEVIAQATIQAMGKDRYGNIEKINLQNAIDKAIGENEAKVYEDGNNFLILFESKRIYTIDQDGNIKDMQKNFENPSKKFANQLEDGNYGTEEKPYEINCIEDLVDLSYTVNGIEVIDGQLSETSANSLVNKHIILNRNLSFSSELSYENSTTTDYGDVNGNGEVEELLTELITGKGWLPIGRDNADLMANFNGNNKEISGLYINNTEQVSYSGLFGLVRVDTIKNLGVLGDIYCNSVNAGGVIAGCGMTEVNISNCYFDGKIENINTSGITGGIIGKAYIGVTINKCFTRGSIIGNNTDGGNTATGGIIGFGVSIIQDSYNEAKIKGVSRVGGICGHGGTIEISDSYNKGNLEGTSDIGGILGYSVTYKISNCYNEGTIIATKEFVGGILGHSYASSNQKIEQCYNLGIIKGNRYIGGILGRITASTYVTIEQCYNFKELTGTTYTAGMVGDIGTGTKILNCYNTGKINGTQIGGIAIGSGQNTTAKIVSCYNTGELNATNKFGVANSGVIYNSYYLETCGATDTIAVSTTEQNLKSLASTLDKVFTIDDEQNTVTISEEETQGVWIDDTNNMNSGYPILKW